MSVDEIHVVYNGKNVETGCSKIASSRKRVLFLSNLKRTKGTLDLLQAVPEVVSEVDNVEFVFVGDWPEQDVKIEFESFLATNPQLPVTCLGVLTGEDKRKIFSCSDIFVFPTYYPAEGHPWVIIEAMAFGLPVISTDQGAICETVIEGKTGFIVPKNGPMVIAKKIIQLLKNEKLRRQMGKAGRQVYRKAFTEEQMTRQLIIAIEATLR